MSDTNVPVNPARADPSAEAPVTAPDRRRRHWSMGLAAAALVVGAGLGAVALDTVQGPRIDASALMAPAPIVQMAAWSTVAVKGQVVEIFGNKFILQDATGRTLVETGPAGEGGDLVARDETVTVQGRFDDGFIHSTLVVHADGRTDAVGPRGGPRGRWALPRWLDRLRADAVSSSQAGTDHPVGTAGPA